MDIWIKLYQWVADLFPKAARGPIAIFLAIIIYLGFSISWKNEEYKELLTEKNKLEANRTTETQSNNKDCNDRITKAIARQDSLYQVDKANLNKEIAAANAYNRELISSLMGQIAVAKRNNTKVSNKVTNLENKIE